MFCRSLFVFSGVTRSSVIYVCFVDRYVSFCPFFFWPLSCLSFTFGHCVVCLLLLAIVLSVLYFLPLCCLSFTFGHCVVCPLLLAIVLSVLYFWPLCCLSFFDLLILITPFVSSNVENVDIQVLSRDMHKYAAGLNRLIGSQPIII
jgi:hypothetical protein